MHTLARASLEASASAAIALWSCTGSLTSLLLITKNRSFKYHRKYASEINSNSDKTALKCIQYLPNTYFR